MRPDQVQDGNTLSTGIPVYTGTLLAALSSISSQDFVHICGGCAALVGTGYTLWKWRRDVRRDALLNRNKDSEL